MNIQKSITLLLGLFLSVSAFAEELTESAAARLVDRIVEAQREGDFNALAGFFHPKSLEYFRRTVSIRLDHIEKTFSPDELEAALGMTRSELERLSDPEFYERVCQRAWEIAPEMLNRPGDDCFVILGVVRDGSLFHALFRSDQSLTSDSDAIVFRRPTMLTFIWSNDQWQLYSVLYGEQVALAFHRTLARVETQ